MSLEAVFLSLGVGILLGFSGWAVRLAQVAALLLAGFIGWTLFVEGTGGVYTFLERGLTQVHEHATVVIASHIGIVLGAAALRHLRREASR